MPSDSRKTLAERESVNQQLRKQVANWGQRHARNKNGIEKRVGTSSHLAWPFPCSAIKHKAFFNIDTTVLMPTRTHTHKNKNKTFGSSRIKRRCSPLVLDATPSPPHPPTPPQSQRLPVPDIFATSNNNTSQSPQPLPSLKQRMSVPLSTQYCFSGQQEDGRLEHTAPPALYYLKTDRLSRSPTTYHRRHARERPPPGLPTEA